MDVLSSFFLDVGTTAREHHELGAGRAGGARAAAAVPVQVRAWRGADGVHAGAAGVHSCARGEPRARHKGVAGGEEGALFGAFGPAHVKREELFAQGR